MSSWNENAADTVAQKGCGGQETRNQQRMAQFFFFFNFHDITSKHKVNF